VWPPIDGDGDDIPRWIETCRRQHATKFIADVPLERSKRRGQQLQTTEPMLLARQPFGRITIANSDAAAYAYTDAAIDQAYRAVQELCMTWGRSTNTRNKPRPEAGAQRTKATPL